MNFFIKIGVSFIIVSFVSEVYEVSNNISKLFVIFPKECGKEMRNHLALRQFHNNRKKAHVGTHLSIYIDLHK